MTQSIPLNAFRHGTLRPQTKRNLAPIVILHAVGGFSPSLSVRAKHKK
ncbi:hypothetical protein PQR02_19230 [Paraburkholderia sediminicola]|uniref:Uncharacterized protein n=1 Tax=Paraburkholderia rhynchosiae TaxID=487049 RepID=A0ACC7NL77_9BURK